MIKRDLVFIFRVLTRKGCKIHENGVISIQKADDLGNKSWGYLEYLQREHGFVITDKVDYRDSCSRKYGPASSEGKKKKSSESGSSNYTSVSERAPSYHAYEGVPSKTENGMRVSEFTHLMMLNHFMERKSRDTALNHRTKVDRIERKARAKVSSFHNYRIKVEELNVATNA